MPTINLVGGWLGMLAGVLSGAVVGLFFHRDDWMGGYGSYRRRLTRLGHISFFGLGFLNLVFVATSTQLFLDRICLALLTVLSIAGCAILLYVMLYGVALIVGAVTMPLCCFLSAWRKPLRCLFSVPVFAVTTGILSILVGWWKR